MDYETVLARNARIVYASITGYGKSGPMVGEPGQDLLAQAFSGLMFSAGKASDGPHPSPCYMADTGASHLITSGILAGLYEREQTGEGTFVETSLLGGLLEMQTQEIMTYLATGESARRCDAPYASAWLEPPYGVYKTSDGWLAFAQNDLFVIADVLDLPELAERKRQQPEKLTSDEGSEWREQCYRILGGAGPQSWAEDRTGSETEARPATWGAYPRSTGGGRVFCFGLRTAF
jgi:crotonobetainyl-CoA:carnitine CoA-transferase CaiB-like acyl-CoA transferase